MLTHTVQTRSSIITGTGSYLPPRIIPNDDFLHKTFFDHNGHRLQKTNREIIEKFQAITGIEHRRYVPSELNTSDIATRAAEQALHAADLDPEQLDYIIVAHNFGDVREDNRRTDIVPSIAARVKQNLAIESPATLAFDLPFGCPGWLQGVILADSLIKAGTAERLLIIGAETLSRIADPHDIDSMIYADGAGAAIVEAQSHDTPAGVLAHAGRSDTARHAQLLHMGPSYNPDYGDTTLFLKMSGHKLYEYALRTVPGVVKQCLEKAALPLSAVHKVLLHQANEKMDDAILKRLFALCKEAPIPANIMPMTISWLGNSSVATLPTLFDLLCRQQLPCHTVNPGDTIAFASVGAGMNINAMLYRLPATS